jgi:hypothetical protein
VDAVDLTPLVFHHVAGEGIVNGDTVRAKVWSIAEQCDEVLGQPAHGSYG